MMSYLVYLTAGNVTLTELGLLAQPDALTGLYSAGQTMVLGIQTVDTGVFGGILLGLLTAFVYDRTCEKAHRGILGGVFSGVRWSFACMAALAAVLGSGACFVWPPIQKAIAAVTGFIAASGNIGLFLYGFLERLLIPTGLHHLVYMPFQFSQLGGQLMVGSVTYTGAYVVMMTEYTSACRFRMASCGCTPALPRPSATLALRRHSSSVPGGAAAKRLPFSCCRCLYGIAGFHYGAAGFSVLLLGTGFVAGARSHLRQLHRAAAPVRSHGVYLEPSGVACDEPFR